MTLLSTAQHRLKQARRLLKVLKQNGVDGLSAEDAQIVKDHASEVKEKAKHAIELIEDAGRSENNDYYWRLVHIVGRMLAECHELLCC